MIAMQTLTNSFVCSICGERWPNDFLSPKAKDICQGCCDDLIIKARELTERKEDES